MHSCPYLPLDSKNLGLSIYVSKKLNLLSCRQFRKKNAQHLLSICTIENQNLQSLLSMFKNSLLLICARMILVVLRLEFRIYNAQFSLVSLIWHCFLLLCVSFTLLGVVLIHIRTLIVALFCGTLLQFSERESVHFHMQVPHIQLCWGPSLSRWFEAISLVLIVSIDSFAFLQLEHHCYSLILGLISNGQFVP